MINSISYKFRGFERLREREDTRKRDCRERPRSNWAVLRQIQDSWGQGKSSMRGALRSLVRGACGRGNAVAMLENAPCRNTIIVLLLRHLIDIL